MQTKNLVIRSISDLHTSSYTGGDKQERFHYFEDYSLHGVSTNLLGLTKNVILGSSSSSRPNHSSWGSSRLTSNPLENKFFPKAWMIYGGTQPTYEDSYKASWRPRTQKIFDDLHQPSDLRRTWMKTTYPNVCQEDPSIKSIINEQPLTDRKSVV